jgi:hypothetical protein
MGPDVQVDRSSDQAGDHDIGENKDLIGDGGILRFGFINSKIKRNGRQ